MKKPSIESEMIKVNKETCHTSVYIENRDTQIMQRMRTGTVIMNTLSCESFSRGARNLVDRAKDLLSVVQAKPKIPLYIRRISCEPHRITIAFKQVKA